MDFETMTDDELKDLMCEIDQFLMKRAKKRKDKLDYRNGVPQWFIDSFRSDRSFEDFMIKWKNEYGASTQEVRDVFDNDLVIKVIGRELDSFFCLGFSGEGAEQEVLNKFQHGLGPDREISLIYDTVEGESRKVVMTLM